MSQSLPKRFFKRLQPKPEVTLIKPKRLQFPSISLTIPEGILQHTLLSPVFQTAFVSGFLLMAVSIVGLDVRSNLAKLESQRHKRSAIEAQITEWKGIVSYYKDYRDGYYQLAVLEYRLGNYEKTYEYLKKVLAIDPHLPGAKQLMEKIAGK